MSIMFRCTNSDPNYGTAWFHCRSRPYDTPSNVIKAALQFLSFEMTSTQSLYVRAVTNYIKKSLLRGPLPTKQLNNHGITTKGGKISPIIFDDDHLSLFNTQCDDNNQIQKARERELLEDFEIVESSFLGIWPVGQARNAISLGLVDGAGGGPLYTASDFVTASIEMNRAIFNRHLEGEEKRKVLFGSDQIIP